MTAVSPVISGPVTGGAHGWPFAAPVKDLAAHGYVIEEFLLEGTARRYRARAGTAPGSDGRWEAEPAETAPYKTRMFVVRPQDPARFNGILVVNWQNVTANVDLGAPEDGILRGGYAWAGVTAQKLGVDGLPGLTKGLSAWDPERYGSLHHPGDAWSYDIYAQAARALKDGASAGGPDPMGGLRPRTVIATGLSQSAMRLGSYINIAHPHDRLFDGFYLVVHWGMCPPIEEASLVEQFAPRPGNSYAATSRIHDRGDAPILVLATECEAFHNFPARQPDTGSFRFWEVAGGTHLDPPLSEAVTAIMARDGMAMPFAPPATRNLVDWSYIRAGGLRWLTRWIREGTLPPRFRLLEIETGADGRFFFRKDAAGNARGGMRLPELAAATGVHKGTNALNPYGALSGESRLFDRAELERLHGDRDSFLAKWDRAVDDLAAADLVEPDQAAALRQRGRAAWG